ncbi:MAG: sterol desaturase family protein [Bacteroidota bacterium]
MVNPIDILIDPISLIIIGMYASLMIWEAVLPGRKLPKIKSWRVRGIISFFVFFYLSTYLPLFWDNYFSAYQLFNIEHLGDITGAIIAVFLYEFGLYIWHFTMHRSSILWKMFHQMHHSAERVDTYGAFYFSPLDMVGWTLLGSVSMVLILGITAQAATIAILTTTFLGIFQHTNVKTPRWIGYIIQRPESHTIHHAKGIHAYNYSDLPIYDILFGTFKNPSSYEHETGFYKGASYRIWDMIRFKRVDKPKQESL